MNRKEELMIYKKKARLEPREMSIQKTVRRSKEIYFEAESREILAYHEFLWSQLHAIQKRWWILQFLLLLALWAALASEQEVRYVQRGMGVMATLFVILIIPELWKSRYSNSMEIEAVSYYSLRQIYAARMLLFGVADIFLLAAFCQAASLGLHMGLAELIVHFLFPLCVTSCICFGTLCSKRCFSETAAIALCMVWSALWLCIVLNENIYQRVTFPIWLGLLMLAIVCLAAIIYRTLKYCNQYLEVSFDGIEI